MKEEISDSIKKRLKKHYFEIEEKNNALVFHLKNEIPLINKSLIIKHAKTGKRISKPIKNSKVVLNAEEIKEIGEFGIYNTFIQFNLIYRDFLLKTPSHIKNNPKKIIDHDSNRVFESSLVKNSSLSFNYFENPFLAKLISIEKNDGFSILNGELEIINDLKFDTVDLLVSSNEKWFYFPCDYEKNEKNIRISSQMNFNLEEDDVDTLFKAYVRLKEDGIILGSSELKASSIEKIEDRYFEIIENDDGKTAVLPYLNKNLYLEFKAIYKEFSSAYLENEKLMKKYLSNKSDKPLVFLESFHGKSYSGQPKYIYEKMLDMGLDQYYNFIWSYEGHLRLPGNPLIVSRKNKNYKKLLKKSKYWISNISFPILKKKGSVYLQTTHGTPYKFMGADTEKKNGNINKGRVLIESGTWDYLLSPNDFSKETFKRAFEYDGEIINKGYPANDVFYQNNEDKIAEIKAKLNLNTDKKIILYAPTYRDYDVDENRNRRFNLLLDFEKLYENLSDDYMLIVRMHYLISKNLELSDEMKEFIIDLSDYDDISDLYLISDILISDYSSAFFDFAHSRKPILFFVPDYERYSSFRGLYQEVKDNLPGPEIETNEELIECLKNIESTKEEYKGKYDSFYNKFCNLGHGTASEDVIDIVFSEVKK